MGYYKEFKKDREQNKKKIDSALKEEMIRIIQIIYPEREEIELKRLSDSKLRGLYGSAIKKRKLLNLPYDVFAPIEEDVQDDYAIPDEEEERRRF